MTTMVASRASEIKKMIFIDSTWAQSKQIYKDPRLKGKINSRCIFVCSENNKNLF